MSIYSSATRDSKSIYYKTSCHTQARNHRLTQLDVSRPLISPISAFTLPYPKFCFHLSEITRSEIHIHRGFHRDPCISGSPRRVITVGNGVIPRGSSGTPGSCILGEVLGVFSSAICAAGIARTPLAEVV